MIDPKGEEFRPSDDGLDNRLQHLAKRCATLEAQNILVPVQQLDLLARTTAWFLSLISMVVYLWLLWNALWAVANKWDEVPSGSLVFALFLVLSSVPYLYNRFTYGSVHRRFEVFCVAGIVIARIFLCKDREKTFASEMDGELTTTYGEVTPDEAIWDANYEISARFLYLSIRRLRGLWVKTAQYLSSRADFMPPSYIRELKKLQDEAPATPWRDVETTLKRANVLSVLDRVDSNPIASASIGQVHVGYLKKSGQKVAIKVQHPHARTLLTDDFWSLKVIASFVSWVEPEYKFFEILMREWAQEAEKELDFCTEASHLELAREALGRKDVWSTNSNRLSFQVEVPQPFSEFCSRNVLIMEFCEGVRVDDFGKLQEWKIPKEDVMDAVAQAFAHFMYVSDIFMSDPHVGNLLVCPGLAKDSFVVTILDWGLAKRLSERKRVAFCQMVYAAATFDFGLLMDSYKTVGLEMKREDTGQSMEDMRFFLRDMAPRGRARSRIKAKLKTDAEKRKETNEKVPMDNKAYPGEFFFFIRVNELLHGLGSKFSVNLGYLDLLRPYAEEGLRQSHYYAVSPSDAEDQPTESVDSSLESKLKSVLDELADEDELVGAQICVLNNDGDALANVVAGTRGGLYGHVPLRQCDLILGFSCTKAITATMAHIMVSEGYLDYDEPICDRIWTRFCPTKDAPQNLYESLDMNETEIQRRWNFKRQITLRHILTHQAGMAFTLPLTLSIQKLASCEECVSSFEYHENSPESCLLPSSKPTEKTEYHFMSFGWLVAGTLCGAYEKRRGHRISFHNLYEEILEPRLSQKTKMLGFRPTGGLGGFSMAQTATGNVKLSKMIQGRRDSKAMGETIDVISEERLEEIKPFSGKEFLVSNLLTRTVLPDSSSPSRVL